MLYECTRAQRRERLGFLLCFQIEGRTPQDPTSQGWDGWLIVTSMEMIWHVFLWLVDGWWYEINLYNDHDMIIIYIYLWKSVKHVFFQDIMGFGFGTMFANSTPRYSSFTFACFPAHCLVQKTYSLWGNDRKKTSIIYYRSLTIIDNYRCK